VKSGEIKTWKGRGKMKTNEKIKGICKNKKIMNRWKMIGRMTQSHDCQVVFVVKYSLNSILTTKYKIAQ
jgi:hypothetical protein